MRLQSLQCLRGIAAFLVLCVHAGLPVKAGAFGVDVFFVLSGVVMAMLMRRPDAKPVSFLRARAFRIWPLYAAASVAFAVALSLKTPALAPGAGDYLGTLLLAPYCPASEWKPLLFVGWTLHYEAFFYICCAAALWLSPSRPALACATLVCLSLCFALFLGHSPHSSFFANPVLLEFVAGMAIWHIGAAGALPRPPAPVTWAALVISLALFSEIMVPGMGMPGSEWNRIMYLAPAAICLVGLALGSDLLGRHLFLSATGPLARIGDASYAIYLAHIPVYLLVKNVVQQVAPVALPHMGIPSIVAALVLGVLLHEKVDAPIQARLRQFS